MTAHGWADGEGKIYSNEADLFNTISVPRVAGYVMVTVNQLVADEETTYA